MTREFVLYSTLGCHLCEDAKAICSPILAEAGGILVEQDIADSQHLMDLYGVRIPVLLHRESKAELCWPFDAGKLRDWLTSL